MVEESGSCHATTHTTSILIYRNPDPPAWARRFSTVRKGSSKSKLQDTYTSFMMRCVTEEIKLDLASSSRKPNEPTVKTSTFGFHVFSMGSMLGMSRGSFFDDKVSERRRARFRRGDPSLYARQRPSKRA
ncbi:hypothetical protein K443DRAFT_682970 [Laccaria amethystina LaAM-08-1]|uniref:Uncharacterized protein n=1 Tax=Laccaria amethystina LaAM-08-1 TaxID=1095629 RepID=A0A0C9WJY8_9AGAR|nr:hypothetical protein K443DRAFT_682970 [Laccaria amethystina LaAM-08-1]